MTERQQGTTRETTGSTASQATFRLLAWQPLSFELPGPTPAKLHLRGQACRIAVRPSEKEVVARRERGGAFIAIEFCHSTSDLLVAAQFGMELIEDFLSGLAIVGGIPFEATRPVQILRIDPRTQNEFAWFVSFAHRHWSGPIDGAWLGRVQALVLHWDGMPASRRLRRAARQYRRALGTENDVAAFQLAYMGLEAMEKPLAEALGIPAGAEEVSGKCQKCGHEYVRRRTVLAGVRAHVQGHVHGESATEQRRAEWKEMNRLRTDLVHGLEDPDSLETRAMAALVPTMHYLRDAICCQSHAHALEDPLYKLVRGMREIVVVGRFTGEVGQPLEAAEPVLAGVS